MTILHKLNCVPQFVLDGLCYLTIGGSTAYGTSNDISDTDILGIYIPPRQYLYPQEFGFILGYNKPLPEVDNVYQIHNIYDGDVEYDINIFNIIHFFKLAKAGNPNIIDMINTDDSFHLFKNDIGKLILENKNQFYSKNMYPRFRGMIKNHMDTISIPKTVGKRAGLVEKYGFDTKDAGHTIRIQLALLDLLRDGSYGLQTHSELIKAIRTGQYSLAEINSMFAVNERDMEKFIKVTLLKENVDEVAVVNLLQKCLDLEYE